MCTLKNRSYSDQAQFWFVSVQGAQINEAACDLAREVANEGDALVAGGVSQTPSYLSCKSEKEVKATFKKQLDVFIKKNVDFLIAEVEKWIYPLSISILYSGVRFTYLSHVDSYGLTECCCLSSAVLWACWRGRVGCGGAEGDGEACGCFPVYRTRGRHARCLTWRVCCQAGQSRWVGSKRFYFKLLNSMYHH